MIDESVIIGDELDEISPSLLATKSAKNTLAACMRHSNFEVIALRQLIKDTEVITETVVVECCNDEVPTWNEVGIQYREILALVFSSDAGVLPEVLSLRDGFPITLHQYSMPEGFPASLCLYSENWDDLERLWTPELHLGRILWWLERTAQGTLHHPDQPVEQLFFRSQHIFMLPPNFNDLASNPDYGLVFNIINECYGHLKTYRGHFYPKEQIKQSQITTVVVTPNPVENSAVERTPYTLGGLHDQFNARNSPIIQKLREEVIRITPAKGVKKSEGGIVLLVLRVPRVSTDGRSIERFDTQGFLLDSNLATLGEAAGVLSYHNGAFYATPHSDGSYHKNDQWQRIALECVEISHGLTKSYARLASGIVDEECEFSGVLAGVGSLGSALAEIWHKQGWGKWAFIDHDYIKPHNLARHTAKDFCLGRQKVDATREIVAATYYKGEINPIAISDKATNFQNPQVSNAFDNADLVIDASTSIVVPRELARRDEIPRCVSVFFTPSALDAVMLFEDKERSIRLDVIEAQYYRAILQQDWGNRHLKKVKDKFVTGASCQDISMTIPYDLIQLHAATLARQVRLQKTQACPCARVWHVNPNTGSITMYEVTVTSTIEQPLGDWRVVWNIEIQNQLLAMRDASLPHETGGIILGYFDHKSKTIYIVDALPAPPDSRTSESHFIRGIDGVYQQVLDTANRTNGIVKYIGDWHSHPSGYSSNPSMDDLYLACYLGNALSLDGQPALMLIVSQKETSAMLCEVA